MPLVIALLRAYGLAVWLPQILELPAQLGRRIPLVVVSADAVVMSRTDSFTWRDWLDEVRSATPA